MFGSKFNLGSLMKNAKKMQEMMEKTQEELAKIEVTGEAGAGATKIIMNAQHYVKDVYIDKEILSEAKEVLEDLIAAAINDATKKIEEIAKSKMMDTGKLFSSMSEDDLVLDDEDNTEANTDINTDANIDTRTENKNDDKK